MNLSEFGYIVLVGTYDAIKSSFQENFYLSTLVLILIIAYTILIYRAFKPNV